MDTSNLGKQSKRRKMNQKSKANQKSNETSHSVNFAIQNENPLLNPFILEMVLNFCKIGNATQEVNKHFPTLRTVSKLWDVEVCKILRPETQIPLPRLISPYPDGLGWKWNRSRKTIGYQYQSPYPETPEFPNVKITITTCKVTKDPKVIRWFKVMGGQIKSLHYSSALNCYHQNKFLGNCVKNWCPNLESLHLSGIQCFASLIYIFEGEQYNSRKFQKGGLNCKNLRSLTISVDSSDPLGYFSQCHDKKNYILLSGRRHDFNVLNKGLYDLLSFVEYLPEKDLEKGEPFYKSIEAQKIDDLPKNYFEESVVTKYFSPDGYFKDRRIDWGVLGLILRDAPLRKIVIKKLNGEQQCRDLTLFLLYQPSKLRSTLEWVEFQDNTRVGRDPICLKILSVWKCPLKYIRLDNLKPIGDSMGYLRDILEGCKGTLSGLEIGVAEYNLMDEMVPPVFDVGFELTNLKKIVVRNVSMMPLEGRWILRNCPSLEICGYFDEGDGEEQLKRRAFDIFCDGLEECADLESNLKELKICGGGMNLENVGKLCKVLGNLRKVDLGVDGASELECLLEWMGSRSGKLEELKVSIGGIADERDDRWNDIFLKHLNKIKNLKFLELDFQKDTVSLSVEAFRNGFAKLKGLTSLKINNFGVLSKDKEKIERSIKHIPFVFLSKMRNHSKLKWLKTAKNAVLSFLKW